MNFGIRIYCWFRLIPFAISIILLCIANVFVQNAFAQEAKPAQTVVVRAGRMFDPVTGHMLERPVVVIVGNKIASVASGNPPFYVGRHARRPRRRYASARIH